MMEKMMIMRPNRGTNGRPVGKLTTRLGVFGGGGPGVVNGHTAKFAWNVIV